jgi:hypothetical protein
MAGVWGRADDRVPQIEAGKDMSALQAWLLLNLPGISSYNQGISERVTGSPVLLRQTRLFSARISSLPAWFSFGPRPDISSVRTNFSIFRVDRFAQRFLILGAGAPGLHPARPPDRGHIFPWSHGPPGQRVNAESLMGSYHRHRKRASYLHLFLSRGRISGSDSAFAGLSPAPFRPTAVVGPIS